MIWMLLALVPSPVIPDAKKPIETFYQTQSQCENALKAENEKGHFDTQCVLVTWKP